MPNPKLETYKNKATGTVYDFTDADAQSKVTATVDLLKDTTGWIGGNLLENVLTSRAVSNVDVTVNDNKTVNLNGTPSENITALFINTHINLKAGKYYLSGNPSGVTGNEYGLRISNANYSINYFFEQGKVLELAQDMTDLRVDIRVPSGTVCDNTLFKPMILTEEQYALNPSYRPYHGSVEEVKADKTATVNLVKDTIGWMGKNLLRFPYSEGTHTRNGITWTVNSDGTITANGTATVDEIFSLYDGNTLPRDTPLTVVGGVSNNVYLYVNGRKNGQWVKTYVEQRGEPKEFTILSTDDVDEIYVRLRINVNQTVNNLVFYPMICRSDEYALSPTYEPYHESVEEMLTPKLLTSANDLDDVKTGGDYYWTQSYPTHSPENNTFGALRVLSCGEVIHQMVVRGAGSSASIYIRRFQETWSSWYKFTGTALS